MKRTFFAVLILAFATSALAGMTYEFSNISDNGQGSMEGSAAIDGEKMRLDLREGDGVMFQDGSVMLSQDGGKKFYVIDTKKKTYYELDLQQLFSTAGAMLGSMGGMVKISFENQKFNVTDSGDGGVIEGYKTKKYATDSSYTLVMTVFGKKQESKLTTRSEIWATEALDKQYMTFVQQKGLKTGFEQLDEIIDKQSSAIKGFPLKQISTTIQESRGKKQTSKSTMTIKSIKETDIPADRFAVPAGYEKVQGPTEALQNMMNR